jgi:protein SCO1
MTVPEPNQTTATFAFLRRAALATAALLASVIPAAAHSLEEVDRDLRDKEQYFQAVDSIAPGFTLHDASGRTVGLGDLGGKVVVLNFDYGEAHGLDPANWVFLTSAPDAPEDSTLKIAESYGLKFTDDGHGVQMHGIVTHVIDQDGRLRARFHGLKFEPVNLVVFVNALTNRTQKPHPHPEPGFWDKLKGSLPW